MPENLPPPPETPPPDLPRPSLLAYVWRGDKFDEIGAGVTQGTGHLVRLSLGAAKTEVIELRGLDPAFYPGQQRPGLSEPHPTFLAFFAGTGDRAGTAWPHPDGKGHRLKLRHPLQDGAEIELRASGHFLAAGENRAPIRKRRPGYHPRISA